MRISGLCDTHPVVINQAAGNNKEEDPSEAEQTLSEMATLRNYRPAMVGHLWISRQGGGRQDIAFTNAVLLHDGHAPGRRLVCLSAEIPNRHGKNRDLLLRLDGCACRPRDVCFFCGDEERESLTHRPSYVSLSRVYRRPCRHLSQGKTE